MNLGNAISVGFKEIWAHKFRSALTMLGIILGVSSLIGMSALVKGMENGMREALIAIGGLEKVRIEQQDVPTAQQHLADQAVGLTVHDLHALKASAPLVRQVSPEMRARNLRVTKGSRNTEWANVIGTWPNAVDINQHTLAHGRMINEIDDESARNVCVIGTNIRDQLFGDDGSPVAHEDLGQHASAGRRHFQHDFVGLDFDQDFVDCDGFARLLLPHQHGGFRNGLGQLRDFDFYYGHDVLFSCLVSCLSFTQHKTLELAECAFDERLLLLLVQVGVARCG